MAVSCLPTPTKRRSQPTGLDCRIPTYSVLALAAAAYSCVDLPCRNFHHVGESNFFFAWYLFGWQFGWQSIFEWNAIGEWKKRCKKVLFWRTPADEISLSICLTHQNGHLSRLKSLGASSLVFLGSVSIGKRGMFVRLHFSRNIPTCHLLPTERLQGTTVYHSDLWYHFASHQ